MDSKQRSPRKQSNSPKKQPTTPKKQIKKEPKNEPDESIPAPQPRIPDATFYRNVVGPKLAKTVVYDLPKNGDPSYPPIKRKPNANSQWDARLWPALDQNNLTQKNKKEMKAIFLLNDNQMADLPYIVGERWGPNNQYQSHFYLYTEVQRRAWEVYGGPEGYRFAKQKHDVAQEQKQKKSPKRRATVPSVSPRYAPYAYSTRWDPDDFIDCFCSACAGDCDSDY